MPTRLIRAALALTALLLSALPAGAVTLQTEVVVTGSQIRLGDLFAGLAPHDSLLAVATAPDAGGRVVLDPEWVVRVARTYGVDWQPGYRVPRVTIRRADAEERAAAASAIRVALSRVIDAGTEHSPTTDAMAAAEAAPAETAAPATAAQREIPVLTRRVRPGDVIGAADIAWRSLPAGRIDPGIVADPEALLGMSVRRLQNADQPVRASDLRLPVVVSRGSLVSMVLESPTLRVTARGRALEDGAMGQTIRVVNVDSSRTVDAIVTGAHAVSIVTPVLF